MVPLGMTLAELRKSKGLKAREVGRRMGQSHVNVLRLENTGSAPIPTLERYAAAIGDDLVTVIRAAQETRRGESFSVA